MWWIDVVDRWVVDTDRVDETDIGRVNMDG
jgi:hypothetical protein